MWNERADSILKELDNLLEDVLKNKQQNEQWFLNFLDRLNHISVMY